MNSLFTPFTNAVLRTVYLKLIQVAAFVLFLLLSIGFLQNANAEKVRDVLTGEEQNLTPMDPRCGPAAQAFTHANAEYNRVNDEYLRKCEVRNMKVISRKPSSECVSLSRQAKSAYNHCAKLRCPFWDFCGITPGVTQIKGDHCGQCL